MQCCCASLCFPLRLSPHVWSCHVAKSPSPPPSLSSTHRHHVNAADKMHLPVERCEAACVRTLLLFTPCCSPFTGTQITMLGCKQDRWRGEGFCTILEWGCSGNWSPAGEKIQDEGVQLQAINIVTGLSFPPRSWNNTNNILPPHPTSMLIILEGKLSGSVQSTFHMMPPAVSSSELIVRGWTWFTASGEQGFGHPLEQKQSCWVSIPAPARENWFGGSAFSHVISPYVVHSLVLRMHSLYFPCCPFSKPSVTFRHDRVYAPVSKPKLQSIFRRLY